MQLRFILNNGVRALLLGLVGAAVGCQHPGATPAATSSAPGSFRASSPVSGEPALSDASATTATSQGGVLVMAHGGDESWNRAVETVVAPLRDAYPIEIAFGMARTSTLRSAIGRLEDQGVKQIAVVRMFVSGESFLDETEYILGLRDALNDAGHHEHGQTMPEEQPAGPMPHHAGGDDSPSGSSHSMEPPTPIDCEAAFVLSGHGVARSELIDDILVDRVRSLSLAPSSECVLILAHGPGDDAENERWLADMRRRTERLREIGPFRDIRCETLREDWPDRRAEAEERIRAYVQKHYEAGARVIVVPFRVANFGPYAEVLEGLEYVADGRGFCPHPNMTLWIDQTARDCLPTLPTASLDVRTVSAD